MFGIESSEQQHMPPVSTQPWFPAASLGQRHMNSEQTFDGTLEGYSSEVWIHYTSLQTKCFIFNVF